jgi:hypothetical protein
MNFYDNDMQVIYEEVKLVEAKTNNKKRSAPPLEPVYVNNKRFRPLEKIVLYYNQVYTMKETGIMDKYVKEKYNCKLCTDVITNPALVECCEATFCSDCIQSKDQCPDCNKSLIENGSRIIITKMSSIFRNDLNSLDIKCRFCSVRMCREQFINHICPQEEIKCGESCEQWLMQPDVNEHRKKCPYIEITKLKKEKEELKLKLQEMTKQLITKESERKTNPIAEFIRAVSPKTNQTTELIKSISPKTNQSNDHNNLPPSPPLLSPINQKNNINASSSGLQIIYQRPIQPTRKNSSSSTSSIASNNNNNNPNESTTNNTYVSTVVVDEDPTMDNTNYTKEYKTGESLFLRKREYKITYVSPYPIPLIEGTNQIDWNSVQRMHFSTLYGESAQRQTLDYFTVLLRNGSPPIFVTLDQAKMLSNRESERKQLIKRAKACDNIERCTNGDVKTILAMNYFRWWLMRSAMSKRRYQSKRSY